MAFTLLVPESWDKSKLISFAMILMALLLLTGCLSLSLNFYISPGFLETGLLLLGATRGISFSLCPSDAYVSGILNFPG